MNKFRLEIGSMVEIIGHPLKFHREKEWLKWFPKGSIARISFVEKGKIILKNKYGQVAYDFKRKHLKGLS